MISTPKHFAVHSGPEPTRHTIDVQVSKHDMEDTYLPAFRAAVTEGKAESVMCAYNRINGQPGCANTFLLKDQLRGAWKFNGYVVSDCDAIVDIYEGHHFAKSQAEAAADALKTGMDNECADFFTIAKDNHDYVPYIDAVKQGLITEADIDVALKRLFTARMRLGMFDPPEKSSIRANAGVGDRYALTHRELALKTARESMVLLKNDGILPLTGSVKKFWWWDHWLNRCKCCMAITAAPLRTPCRRWKAPLRKEFAGAQVSFEAGTDFLRERPVVPTSALSTDKRQARAQGRILLRRAFRYAAGNPRRSVRRSSTLSSGCPRVARAQGHEGFFGPLDRISDPGTVRPL